MADQALANIAMPYNSLLPLGQLHDLVSLLLGKFH